MYGNDLIDIIAPFQNSYSDVSLFLSRKIKELGTTAHHTKGWSLTLQEQLLQKITSEFGKKFPRHRLGTAVLKKKWEKISHLSQLFEEQREALTPNGRLDLHFLIRENLKTILAQRKNSSFHPFLLAQNLALKVGESLAVYEGIRPQLEQLTELIWTALYHLIPPVSHTRTPTQNILGTGPKASPDVKDRLITKWVMDTLTTNPAISYRELTQVLHKKLKFCKILQSDRALQMHQLCMNWATTLLPHTTLFQTQSSMAIRELKAWINKLIYDSSKNLEQQIQDIKTSALTERRNLSLYDLEILSWSCLSEMQPPITPSPVYDELLQEAKSHLIYHPQQHWKMAITQADYLLEKARKIAGLGNTAEWNHRIELWSSQGELILRSLKLPDTPILHLVRTMHLKNHSLTDPSITTQLREQYLYRYQSPLIEPSEVHQAADFVRKYGWYHLASTPQDTTFDRWILLNKASLVEGLQEKAQERFPLMPFLHRNTPIKINGIESH